MRFFLAALLALFCAATLAPSEATAQDTQVSCHDGVLSIPDQRPQIVFASQDMCQGFAAPYRQHLRGNCYEAGCRGAAFRIAYLNEDLQSSDIMMIGFISSTVLYRCSADATITPTPIPTPDIRFATLIDRTVQMPSGAAVGPVRCPQSGPTSGD
jgi:hypothetical protein